MPRSAALEGVIHLPFAEQITFFRRKLNVPTERWDDVWQAAHDRAFVVAGAAKADLLEDLRGAVDKAVSQGTTLAEFRRDFRDIVKRRGWTGWTGEGTQGGEAWRTRTIYETNLRTSYAAGRHAQLTDPELLASRPFWRYVHSDTAMRPRPLHKRWGDMRLTLRHDHPFWQTHFPPNGWGCRCRVTAVREPAPGDATVPPQGWDAINEATGAPAGIDRGWAYAPGANAATPLVELVGQKLLNLEAPTGAAMWDALAPALAMEREMAWWGVLGQWQADGLRHGRVAVVGGLSPRLLRWIGDNGLAAPASAAIVAADRLLLGAKQRRHERSQDGLTAEEWRALPQWLDNGAVYLDVASGHMMFVADGVGPAKVAVEFAVRSDRPNEIVSAFRTAATDVAGMVKGGLWRVAQM